MLESVLIYCTSGGLESGWELDHQVSISRPRTPRSPRSPLDSAPFALFNLLELPLQNAIDLFSLLSQVAESTERARPRGSRWRRSCSVR